MYWRGFAPLHGFRPSTPQQSVLATSPLTNLNPLCNRNEGGKLSPRELQLKYMSALSRITGAPADADAKRQTPIFQREPAVTEKELIQNAANALAALWRVRDPIKP